MRKMLLRVRNKDFWINLTLELIGEVVMASMGLILAFYVRVFYLNH